MAQQEKRSRQVQLTASEAIEIEPGVTLPAGNYHATETRIGIALHGGMTWTTPDYKIEFMAEELANMGARNTGNFISAEIPVTKFVRAGQLSVTSPLNFL